MSQNKGFERRYRVLREIIETLTLTLLMFLIIRFAVQNFRVDGMSMEPTLHNQEYILVNKAAYVFHAPQRGDVIVFEYPLDPQVDYVKRIIAIPGDVISIAGEKVTVDGVTLREPYVNPSDPFNPFPPIFNRTVPQMITSSWAIIAATVRIRASGVLCRARISSAMPPSCTGPLVSAISACCQISPASSPKCINKTREKSGRGQVP